MESLPAKRAGTNKSLQLASSIGLKVLLLVVAYVLTDGIARLATQIQLGLGGNFIALDPDNVFAGAFIHHIAQGLIAFAVILIASILYKKPLREFGFNTNGWKWSLRTTGFFCLGWIVCYTAGVLLTTPVNQIVTYPMNFRNAAGYSLFMLTMPGPSEETLFRALPYFILGFAWKGSVSVFKLKFSHIAIITALMFTVAHIGFSYIPFKVFYIMPAQLVMALGLGLFYGYMFDKTGSLLGPMLVHAASDFLGILLVYGLVLITA